MRPKELITQLKSDNREDRCYSMDMLSKLRGKNEIDKLIYVAKGKRRSFIHFYDFYDQEYAMESLIRTQLQDALNFLRWFFDEEITIRNVSTLTRYTSYYNKNT